MTIYVITEVSYFTGSKFNQIQIDLEHFFVVVVEIEGHVLQNIRFELHCKSFFLFFILTFKHKMTSK